MRIAGVTFVMDVLTAHPSWRPKPSPCRNICTPRRRRRRLRTDLATQRFSISKVRRVITRQDFLAGVDRLKYQSLVTKRFLSGG